MRARRHGRLLLAACVAFCLAFAGIAWAAAGDLDRSFSDDGKVRTDFANSQDTARAVARQSDGKIVVAGVTVGDFGDFGVARYKPDGTLDRSFGGDGKVRTAFSPGSSETAHSVTIQENGRIVVAGIGTDAGGSDFAVARYRSNGELDDSFSGNGKQMVDIAGSTDLAEAVAIQANGRIVLAGQAFNGPTNFDFALVRLQEDGDLDDSFSGNGKQTTDFRQSRQDFATGVGVQEDGKIVAAGSATRNAAGDDFALARYKTNGDLDRSFSDDGRVTTNFYSTRVGEDALDMTIQPNGRIVVAGIANNEPTVPTTTGFAAARYKTNGDLDDSFSRDGKQITDIGGGGAGAEAVAVDPNGRIVLAGRSIENNQSDFAVVRYRADGSLDGSFSGNGRLTTNLGSASDEAYDVLAQPNARIVVVGRTGVTTNEFAVVRYQG